MTGDWSVVLRDREASRWLDLSVWAFWLKHPGALVAPQLNEAQQFRRLGEELYVLEYDLTSVLFVFKTAYQVDYQGGEHLSLKKFSIVYHIDNFHVRAHKMIENVEALLAMLGGVDPQVQESVMSQPPTARRSDRKPGARRSRRSDRREMDLAGNQRCR